MSESNVMATVKPWDLVAEGYAQTNLEFFSAFAEEALKMCHPGAADSVLDVACGPGTLSVIAAKQAKSVHAVDFSPSMISQFQQRIADDGQQNIFLQCADGENLPFADNQFDFAFSMFGLMFFARRDKGYAEILRTLKPGGRAVISSWAPVEMSSGFVIMFGAIRAMNPDMPAPKADMNSLENPQFFAEEMRTAGFKNVETHEIKKDIQFDNIEDIWAMLSKGSAPVVMMKKHCDAAEWKDKEGKALGYLRDTVREFPASFSSVAWFACGDK